MKTINSATLTLLMTSSGMLWAIKHPTELILVDNLKAHHPVQVLLTEADPLSRQSCSQFVLTLKNGLVVNEGGIVTDDGKILDDTQTFSKDQHRLMQGNRDITQEPIITFEGKLAVISSPGQENWYHWLFQVLGRLKILNDSKIAYDKIYINNVRYRWQKESLFVVMEKLGISKDRLYLIDGDIIIQAHELIVPSVPFIPSKQSRRIFPIWLKDFIHSCFLIQSTNTRNFCNKLYISRDKAQVRKIANEESFIQLLTTLGFQTVYLEDLSIAEQAQLFNHADVIVGPHGSGFTNLIFSKPGTFLIEIDHQLPGEDQRSFYKKLCTIMNCQYVPFYTDIVDDNDDDLNKNLSVDLQKFKQFYGDIQPITTTETLL